MTKKEPTYVHCNNCNHEWILFYSPIPVRAMVKLCTPNVCIYCHTGKVFMGSIKKNVKETEEYIIFRTKQDEVSIYCKTCKRSSYNRNDVEQRYCPCKGFHKKEDEHAHQGFFGAGADQSGIE